MAPCVFSRTTLVFEAVKGARSVGVGADRERGVTHNNKCLLYVSVGVPPPLRGTKELFMGVWFGHLSFCVVHERYIPE